MTVPYDPQISRIVTMTQVLKNYQQDFDMIKAAEMHYERMRTLNKTTLLQIDIKKSFGNILGSLSVDTIWSSPKDRIISAALAEARASIFSRAVGPLEGLPVADYMQDSVRMQNVMAHTMIGPEQRLIAKLSQMQGNKWYATENFQYNLTTSSTDGKQNVVDSQEAIPGSGVYISGDELRKNLFGTEFGAANTDPTLLGPIGPAGKLTNKWHDEKYGKPYSASEAKDVANEFFNFTIKNLAIIDNPSMSFPAHIINLNEAVSTSWGNISLINRSEDVYIYQRAERTFNFEFWIFASNDEIPPYDGGPFPSTITVSSGNGDEEVGLMSKTMMWERINFLHTLTRPEYTSEGLFNKSPYCKLYLAGLFDGIHVIFDSININYDPLIWDMNIDSEGGVIKPMIAQITMSGKFLHNVTPSVKTNFYGEK